ncbi:MAG: hypothetical protein KDE68_02960 [Rhodocyclaceae bacterium]|nr:hypothetical protein [Rhodocyclaceae bacterium]
MMHFTRLALLLLIAQPSLASAAQGPSIFCCENAQGHRVCGDVLPQACYGRAYRRVASDGTVIERIAAPMSPEERAEAARLERLQELEQARRRSQMLQDRALLDTYRSLDDIDQREARAVADINKDLHREYKREDELKKNGERLQEEAKLHPPGGLPPDLSLALRDNQSELAAQQTVIDAKLKNIEAVRARFSRDRERFLILTDRPAR